MTDGAMGALPDWYPFMRAAKYLNVAPWELLAAPYFWTLKALISEAAESDAQEAKMEEARQQTAQH